MAQNYYIAKVLGIDQSGHLFSKEMFDNAAFYLDTNVLIEALEPKSQYHKSFEALSKACKQLKVELRVCQISIHELLGVVESKREVISRVADQIPEDTAPKVRGVFYSIYREHMASTGTADLDKIFANFDNPIDILTRSYDVKLIDDYWFIEAKSTKETKELVTEVRDRYFKIRKPRIKREKPALHDALLLQWIQLEQKNNPNVLLVTLDTSLPGFLPKIEEKSTRSMAITLDALFQWISPLAINNGENNEFAAIFSEAVKYQLLPQESFFELRDFLMFAEMEWTCKNLPSKDVEGCIRYFKAHAPNLDPSNREDREKIAHEMSKFFADPGRKYKREVQNLENEIERIQKENERKQKEDACKQEEKRLKDEEEKEKLRKKISARNERIEKLEKEQAKREEKDREKALKKSAYFRLFIVVLFFFVLEAGACYVAKKYGVGENLVQKIKDLWSLFVLSFSIAIGFFCLILGKDRIRALGWPFNKYL